MFKPKVYFGPDDPAGGDPVEETLPQEEIIEESDAPPEPEPQADDLLADVPEGIRGETPEETLRNYKRDYAELQARISRRDEDALIGKRFRERGMDDPDALPAAPTPTPAPAPVDVREQTVSAWAAEEYASMVQTEGYDPDTSGEEALRRIARERAERQYSRLSPMQQELETLKQVVYSTAGDTMLQRTVTALLPAEERAQAAEIIAELPVILGQEVNGITFSQIPVELQRVLVTAARLSGENKRLKASAAPVKTRVEGAPEPAAMLSSKPTRPVVSADAIENTPEFQREFKYQRGQYTAEEMTDAQVKALAKDSIAYRKRYANA